MFIMHKKTRSTFPEVWPDKELAMFEGKIEKIKSLTEPRAKSKPGEVAALKNQTAPLPHKKSPRFQNHAHNDLTVLVHLKVATTTMWNS